MKSKKIISIMLVLTMLLATLTVVSGAAGTPTVSVGTVEANPGEKVSVPVIIENNPGIAAYTLGISYDNTRLSLDSVTNAAEFGGMFEFGTKAVWASEADVTKNGKILTLEFTVLDNAPAGNAAVTVTYGAGDVCNFNEENVNPAVVPGSVKIVADTDTPVISVGSVDAAQGSNVDVPVYFNDNPGIAAVTLAVEYDDAVLTFIGADTKVGGYIEAGSKLVWAAESDVKTSGEFFVLHFSVADDAPLGDTAVSLACNAGDICNFNEENVSFALESGKVTVTGSQLVVGDAQGYIGGSFDVPVSIVKNPGVAAMTLSVEYDEDILTFTGADLARGVSGMLEAGTKLVWAAESDVTKDGELFILHFTVKGVESDITTPVTLSYTDGDICNFDEQDVALSVKAGSVSVSSVLRGDLDFDGKITLKDINIQKSLVVGSITPSDKMKAAGDLNGDGKITIADVNLLKGIYMD